MYYIFVVNGRKDKSAIAEKVEAAIAGLEISIDCEVYTTAGAGDATRFVNLYCDLNPAAEVCFVACGGAGIANEVASALVGKQNKTLALFHCDGTNDFVKSFPGRDFTDLAAVLGGTLEKIDVIKANDYYAINVANAGLDAQAALLANDNILEGKKNPYAKGVLSALLFHRRNRIEVSVDGKHIGRKVIQQLVVANGQYYGGVYRPAPDADVADGLFDICVLKPMSIVAFLYFVNKIKTGAHITDKFCRKKFYFMRGKHVGMKSDDLIYLCLDGEIVGSSRFEIDVLEKALTILIPRQV